MITSGCRRGHLAGKAGLLLVLVVSMPTAAGASTDAPLRVGVYQNEPKVFVADDGSAQGFFPFLIAELATRVGRRVTYHPCTWNACLEALAAGELDLLPDVAYSEPRAQRFRFGHEAALHAVSYMYARAELEDAHFDVLDGSRLAIVEGSIQRDHMHMLARERDWQVELVEVSDMRSVLTAVAEGVADFGIVNDFFGEAAAPDLGLVRTRFVLQPTPLFLAYRPNLDPVLIARFDAELAALKAAPDSIYYDAYRRWILRPQQTDLPAWTYWAGLLALVGLLAAVTTAAAYRRRAHGNAAALHMSRERLATITEVLDVGVWEWDVESGHLVWDDAMYRLFGMGSDQTIDSFPTFFERVHPDDRQRLTDEIENVLTGRGRLDTEFRIQRADNGELRHLKVVAQVAADTPGSMFGINLDITRMRSLEDQVQQTQKMEALGALTGGIAHDFNNMLMVISSNLELAEELAGDPALTEMLADARKATDRGSELTRRLLTFSRRQVLEATVLDLNDHVRRTATFLNRIIPESIRIETRLHPTPLYALVDPGQLENALVNLAINARDAMPNGGSLMIICEGVRIQDGEFRVALPPGHYQRIVVADDGVGMPESVRQQAMDPFFTTKKVGQGTGLGLAMVYGFVRQSGGDVHIDSTVGSGTRIELYFPSTTAATTDAEPGVETPIDSAARARTVLLVEDDPEVRHMLEKLLGSLGMWHHTCPDAPSALAFLETPTEIDILLSDVVMPSGMSGIELARHLRTIRPTLPIILMSGYSGDREDTEETLPHGVVWLQKPFTRAQLIAALRTVLEPTVRG